jgi:hypothetical protein
VTFQETVLLVMSQVTEHGMEQGNVRRNHHYGMVIVEKPKGSFSVLEIAVHDQET